VYESFDTQLKRRVAVKVNRPDLMTSPDALARFRREATTAAGLCHPSVVNVHDYGVAADGRTYLVMELLKGRSLREELRERTTLDSETTLTILRSVSAAVALAHARGLLHRDLKPENIFLAESEHGQVAKILDFGLVKPLNPGSSDTVGNTLPGAAIGTPAYMSPEQRRGEMPDETWDVWALAVVAFEMLTGSHPFAFSAESPGTLAVCCSPDPSVEAPALSPSVQALFERAFALDSSRRPMSVHQLIEELEMALQ
jgi:serine/threonine-protein kinase